jgi:RNA polymerase sigma-70 factor (ECF subfamily)
MLAVSEREQLPVGEARAGDPEAWDILFRRYQLPLYTYVFELVHQEQASLDIVQETFISAVRHLGTLREDSKFGSWLFGIAHQKCVQQWRRQSRLEAAHEDLAEAPPAHSHDPCELLIRDEDEELFMTCLNQLPAPQRSVLLLHYLEGFSLEEIGGITAANLGTVKSRLHYAKKALSKLMENYPR